MTMRRCYFGALLLSVFFAAILTAPKAESAPSNRMQCKGGGDMTANYYPRGESGSATQSELQIHFRKAQQAAKDKMPGPGECAWMNRPISEKEPYWLSWKYPRDQQGVRHLMFGSREGNEGVRLPPNRSEHVSGLIMAVNGQKLAGLIRAVHYGGHFNVDCQVQGIMCVVTRIVSIAP